MKKTIKSKLRLNSQTIRNLRDVHGGRPIQQLPVPDDSINVCTGDTVNCSANCSVGCRGCG